MQVAAIGVAAVSLLIWLYLFFFNGHFWQIWIVDADREQIGPPAEWPRVVAVVPARNEAETIARTVASLAQQDYPGQFSIIVVDDHSEDGTGALARKALEESNAREKVRVVDSAPLVPGWTGKLWALQNAVEATDSQKPDFFWFTDADIIHAPDTLRRLVSRAERDTLDLTSLMVLLQTETFTEKLIIPPFLYFFLMLYPPRWIANPKSRTAGAAGGCVLLRRSALARIGGLAAIRSEIIDDCSLARAVKRSGGQIWMGLTRRSVSLRRYSHWSELQNMIARTAFTQLNYSVLQLIGTLAGLALTFVAPVALALSTNSRIWLPALLAWCLMSASFLPTVVFYRLSPIWSPFLPIAAVFYAYATFLSAIRYWLGRGGQWKGRAQAPGTED
ncbi:MAG: glycosyltransferase [Acidobacteria bacterium]|nr:glycosyltransferase [Acidobacteriota bacterium]MBS1865188.1 glycosyltransferase [Acidobacteriota bacterium]